MIPEHLKHITFNPLTFYKMKNKKVVNYGINDDGITEIARQIGLIGQEATTENLKHIELIPLFEDIETILHSDSILETYVQLHKKAFGYTPEYLRPYIARGDPALNSGLIPTVLATKIALS